MFSLIRVGVYTSYVGLKNPVGPRFKISVKVMARVRARIRIRVRVRVRVRIKVRVNYLHPFRPRH